MVNPSTHIYMYTCINIASYQYVLNMYVYFISFALEKYAYV